MTHGTLLINTNQVNGLAIVNGAALWLQQQELITNPPLVFANQRKDAKRLTSSNLYALMESC